MSLFRRGGGSSIRRSTSGGNDKGALPIRDLHLGVVEMNLDCCGRKEAGTRNPGRATKAPRGATAS